MVWPVMKLDRSETRNTNAPAISFGSPKRPRVTRSVRA